MNNRILPPSTYPVTAQFSITGVTTMDLSIARISGMTKPRIKDTGVILIDGHCIEIVGGHNGLYAVWQEYLSMKQIAPLN